MTVIDSFFFQFEADGAKLKSGLKEADKSTDDLGKRLEGTDQSASQLGSNLEKLAITAGKALAGLFALHELKKVTMETVDHTYAIAQQARAMNVNVESLSAWQQAVKESGGTAEGATQSMAGLRDKFVEMARFGNAMGPEAFMFEKLGLSAKEMHASIKDPMIAMGKLADVFGKLDRTKALFLGNKLGLDQGTINLLMQGRRGLDEMIQRQKELGVVTQAQADAATKFKLKTVELGIAFETVSRDVTGALLPAFVWLMDKVEKIMVFFHEHKAFALGFFGALTVAVGAFAIATNLAALPFILIGAAILLAAGAIALIVDDIHSFIEGGDSLIGRAVNKWPVLGKIFHAIGDAIKESWELAKKFFDLFKNAPEAIFKFITKMVGADTPDSVNSTKMVGADTPDSVNSTKMVGADTPEAIFKFITKMVGADTPDSVSSMVNAGKTQLGATNTPLNNMNSNSISNSINKGGASVHTGPITINTQATSGKEVARALDDHLQHHLKNAINHFDDGRAG